MPIERVLVANRGEIALRVIRAAHGLGIETVLACSAADRDSLPARIAQRTVVVGPAQLKQSYLDPALMVHAALQTGCDALHPGYGFLAERPELARMCADNDVRFVGPRADTIEALGDKLRARGLAEHAGVPLSPGTDAVTDCAKAQRAAAELGYPVVMKASAGGGGRGMFVARSAAEIAASFDKAAAESLQAFGDATLFMERFVENARHVEVQIVGDGEGKVIHFGERDCSIQRRYQKVIEEAPCSAMADTLRQALHQAAVDLLASLNYRNAGTVEFLYDMDRDAFYFMEVNTRIQVEHPVSEQVTGVDLVQQQFKVAGGEGLAFEQSQIKINRHAIECRINAEDPARDFRPSPGRISDWQVPKGAGIRLESHCHADYVVPPFYDSMIGKLIVTANDRPAVIERLGEALREFHIAGLTTNVGMLGAIVEHADFRANRINTRWLESQFLPAFG